MRLSRIDQHIKYKPCAKQRAFLGVSSSRSSSVSRENRSTYPIHISLPLVSYVYFIVYMWFQIGIQILYTKFSTHTGTMTTVRPYIEYSHGYSCRHGCIHRGFERKGARVRIITFRVTTRLRSKSNRCIWRTILAIWLLIWPGSSNSSKFYIAKLVQMPVLTAHYGSHHTKPVCMGNF